MEEDMPSSCGPRRQTSEVLEEASDAPLKNKPIGSATRQQRLESWQPLLTASTVLPSFLAIGLLFVPIGVLLLTTSNSVQEIVIDYTQCPQEHCTPKDVACTCEVAFQLRENFEREVYLYYSLVNYFQNHRRYVKSRDDDQLRGHVGALGFDNDCEPLDARNGKTIGPCGFIANSLFNDTFALYYQPANVSDVKVNLSFTDIAWATDKHHKFKNPSNLTYAFDNLVGYYAPPPNWGNLTANHLDDGDASNNGYRNERFLVWMRVSAFSTFRKLWARIVHSPGSAFEDGLPKGKYLMVIEYNYPVQAFHGEKKFIISNTSWMGGKGSFLGVAYIVVGCLILALTAFLYYIHRKYGKSHEEFVDITVKTPYF